METGWVPTGSLEGFPSGQGRCQRSLGCPRLSPVGGYCLLNAGSMLGWRLQPLGGHCCLSAVALRASRVGHQETTPCHGSGPGGRASSSPTTLWRGPGGHGHP